MAIQLSEILSSSNTVSANIKSLDQLDVSLATAFIVKQFRLIGLVEARIQLEQNHWLQPVRQTRHWRNEEQISKLGHCSQAAFCALDNMLSQVYSKLIRHTVKYDK